MCRVYLDEFVRASYASKSIYRGRRALVNVIWAKDRFTRSDYQQQCEPLLYGWREVTDAGAARGIKATCGS